MAAKSDWTVGRLKGELEKKFPGKIPASLQRLFKGTQLLHSDMTLEEASEVSECFGVASMFSWQCGSRYILVLFAPWPFFASCDGACLSLFLLRRLMFFVRASCFCRPFTNRAAWDIVQAFQNAVNAQMTSTRVTNAQKW